MLISSKGNCLRGSRPILSYVLPPSPLGNHLLVPQRLTEYLALTRRLRMMLICSVCLAPCFWVLRTDNMAKVMKKMFIAAFGVPPGARKAKPFIDRVMSFSVLDGKVRSARRELALY